MSQTAMPLPLLFFLLCRRLARMVVLVAVAGATGVSAQALPSSRDTVLWHINSFAPYTITSGPQVGQGINDHVMELLMKGMPEFQHKVTDASLARVLENFKTRPDACSVSLLRTPEREAMMHFSNPRGLLLPNALVMMRSRAHEMKPFLNAHGEVVLASMLADGRLKLGLSTDRSYGQPVDQVIKRHPDSIVTIAAKDQFTSRLLKLVNQNEFDVVIGYAIELRYTVQEMKMDLRDFVVYPIAESSGLLTMGVACSKSEQGQRIINAVNRVLADKSVRRELDARYRSWLDEDSAAHYDRLLRQHRGAGGGKGAAL